MRRPRGSVRLRAAAGATAVVAVALVITGMAVLLVLRADLRKKADEQARIEAHSIATTLASGTPPDAVRLDEATPTEITDSRGRVLASNVHLTPVGTVGQDALPTATAATATPVPLPSVTIDPPSLTPEPQGRPAPPKTVRADGVTGDYRWAAHEVTGAGGEPIIVNVGSPVATERSVMRAVKGSLLIGLPLLLAVVGVATWLVTGRALRPVENIRREMAAITASSDLSRRVPVPASRDEIARLARTTNATLATLEGAVERQRRFVADASHELRNPIASLRTQLEVGASHPALLDVGAAAEDVARLQRLTTDLLLLARLDAGEQPLSRSEISLADLVEEELAQRVGDRIPVRLEPLADLNVEGARSQLARVLGNLVDNAQRHAASEVVVSVRARDGMAVLQVADDGDGVPENQRERIFERFVRLDAARRADDDGGAGLGLAIARDVTVRHGGSLVVRARPGGGALFEAELPYNGNAATPRP
ncbi:HAMP domain-containing histidine kinase [Actinoallomurus purpureus]|uniref:sensor histidine kinase n=1 Tax=Actinoallomurus purpureus TaxID=478114 RepID=UPI00209258EE|nr:HAMP domain-containing sensor histidine kinase [Actinoallomurus purpureus]MCO6003874.1 HAMP domain-containing histidine kinase [Actinoallomurus purpureus]